jgi:SAM-dependent methyltransferase
MRGEVTRGRAERQAAAVGPPLRLRLAGRASSFLVARAPALWPLLRPPTHRFWERSAKGWDDRIKPERSEHLAPLLAACDELEVEPGWILELGTGTGAGARALATRFANALVVGVDLSETMIRSADEKIPSALAERVSFAVADAGELPYEDGTFDLVAQLNLPVYFDEVARVLRPGGHVIVASSLGPITPYYTPLRALSRGLSRRGVDAVQTRSVGGGDYYLGRRRSE